MKLEKAGLNQTLVIDRTKLYTTVGRVDRQTDRWRAIYPSFSKGVGHNNCSLNFDPLRNMALMAVGYGPFSKIVSEV